MEKQRETVLKGPVGDYTVTFRPRIGGGTFGQVYEATHNVTGNKVAVKEIRLSDAGQRNDYMTDMAERELAAMICLQKHNNIVSLYEHIVQEDACFLFMQYCELNDLKVYLNNNKDLSFLSKLKIMQQCASAVAFMHSQKPPIIHRDIKLENILLTMENGEVVVKLTDFGLSKLCDEYHSAATSSYYAHNKFMTTACGTGFYQAPEFFEEKQEGLRYSASVDTFALGCVFTVLFEFGVNNPGIFPLSVDCKRAGTVAKFGLEMLDKHRQQLPLPTLVESRPDDDAHTQRIKRIIVYMTKYRDSSRKNICEVEEELTEIIRHHAEITGGTPLEPRYDETCSTADDKHGERQDASKAEIVKELKASPPAVHAEERLAILYGVETKDANMHEVKEELHVHCFACVNRACTEKDKPPHSCAMTFCASGCGARYHRCKHREHQECCPKRRVPCLNKENGCPAIVLNTPQDWALHLDTCPAIEERRLERAQLEDSVAEFKENEEKKRKKKKENCPVM